MSISRTQELFYRICKGLALCILPWLYPMEVHGKENIPEGPFIFCSNHVSILDCIFMGVMVMPRKASFMAKNELFANRLTNWIMSSYGAFPVNRGTADLSAMKVALQSLKEERPLVIFPEGTRNRNWQGSFLPFNKGTGFIALMSKKPVVPVFFANVHGFKPFRKVQVWIGEPVDFTKLPKGPANSEKTAAATDLIYEEMTALMKNAMIL